MVNEFVEKAITCLNSVGVELTYNDEDFELNELEMDSIQFISFIVELENCFSIEFPDELLVAENMTSFYALINIIDELQKNKSDNN